jgi:hypothetical protein
VRWALLITIAQVAFMMALAPGGSDLKARYIALNNWDSFHYERIAQMGYQIPAGEIHSEDIHEGRANVVFFPGYPMAGRMLSKATGLSVPVSLLFVSQAACFVFWLYFFLLFDEFEISETATRNRALATVLHPAAFFLVAGYTETLFLTGMMGFLYWSSRWNKQGGISGWIAAAHGMVMSVTRIVAFAPAAYPSFQILAQEGFAALKKPRFWKAVAISFAGICGALLFFAYCQARFGRWNLYFQLEEIGWQNHRRWFAVLNPMSYVPRFFFEHSVDSLNRFAVLVTGVQLVQTFPKKELKRAKENTKGSLSTLWPMWPMWSVAFVLFYIALTGKANANMDSMLRYTLPPFMLLLLLRAKEGPIRRTKWLWVFGILSFAVQVWCAYRFLHGRWVA